MSPDPISWSESQASGEKRGMNCSFPSLSWQEIAVYALHLRSVHI
jgi:hypothetical protein